MQKQLDLENIVETTIGNVEYKLYMGGRWRDADNGATFPVTNPATGQTLTTIPDAGANETRAAIDAAAAAMPTWAATSAQARAELMRKVAALMLERRERLATVMTLG